MQRAVWFLVLAFSTLTQSASAQSADSVLVHLNATDHVVLQQKQGRAWVDVCVAPCDRFMDGDQRYRIEGAGVRATNPFRLRATSLEGSETLDVTPSYVSVRNAGFVLVGVGAAGVFVGSLLAWVGVSSDRCEGSNAFPNATTCEVAHPGLIVVGLVTAASSAIVGGIGAVLAIGNSHSTVDHAASATPRVRFLASDVPLRWDAAPETYRARTSTPSTTMMFPVASVAF